MGSGSSGTEGLEGFSSGYRLIEDRPCSKTYLDLVSDALVDERLILFAELNGFQRAKTILTFRNSLIPNVAEVKLWHALLVQSTCSQQQAVRVLIERPRGRLSDLKLRSEEETVLVARQAILGFNALFKYMRQLPPLNPNMIFFDRSFRIRVWLNSDLFAYDFQDASSNSHPESENSFIAALVSIIQKSSETGFPPQVRGEILSKIAMEAAIKSLSIWLNKRIPFSQQGEYLRLAQDRHRMQQSGSLIQQGGGSTHRPQSERRGTPSPSHSPAPQFTPSPSRPKVQFQSLGK